jgi:hypothetical protein
MMVREPTGDAVRAVVSTRIVRARRPRRASRTSWCGCGRRKAPHNRPRKADRRQILLLLLVLILFLFLFLIMLLRMLHLVEEREYEQEQDYEQNDD